MVMSYIVRQKVGNHIYIYEAITIGIKSQGKRGSILEELTLKQIVLLKQR
jgi:hypothetical protein